MCGISGSFDINVCLELYNQNIYRGNKNISIVAIDYLNNNKIINNIHYTNDVFELDISNIKNTYLNKNYYYVIHNQAPTTNSINVHPAIIDNNLLWHNGILKDFEIKRLQKKYNTNILWDTQLLLLSLLDSIDNLNEINGSFSCLYKTNNNFYIFRNNIAVLYIDEDFNISTTEFMESKLIDSNNVYQCDFLNKKITLINKFNTKETPYFFI